jgi:predicted O-methyltransferase YrrM
MLTKQHYDEIFEKEKLNEYKSIDAFEAATGHRVPRERLEEAARVLACPVKVNPPNWQHGRVIYAAAMVRLRAEVEGIFLDIGTAKGFSACVMTWAIADAQRKMKVVTVDMMDPYDRVKRNSVAELGGYLQLTDFIDPFRDKNVLMEAHGGGSARWFKHTKDERIAFAFIDGKHTYDAVRAESIAIAEMQTTGDVIVFDDLQIEPVRKAAMQLEGYDGLYLDAGQRRYLVAVRQ